MRIVLLLVGLMSLLVQGSLASDYFSSVTGLEELLHTEDYLTKELRSKVNGIRTLLDQLEG